MMRFLFLFFLLLISNTIQSPANEKDPRTHHVVVSLAPYKYFVEAIGGDTITIGLLVPPDTSFHNYEPTPKQVLQTANADIWFRIGETFEARAIQALASHHAKLRIVDLRNNVDLITIGHVHCTHCEGADLHIWLSPRQVKIQAQEITKALSEVYPENKEFYQKRFETLSQQLDDLDVEIANTLKSLKSRTMMVFHPSYAYFARDYHLTQLPIEFEGKDPSPKQLQNIIDQAKAAHIKTIYVQREYGTKGAGLIANALGANIVELSPYSGDYFVTMRNIANRIAAQDQSNNR